MDQKLVLSIVPEQVGKLIVELVNPSPVITYFDDLRIRNVRNVVIQEDHYYPFGMNLAGLSYAKKPENQFQFNGKEKQTALGLQLYDYGARQYDPQLGRFHSVDPMAGAAPNWTAYRFGFNNPISFTDPTGMYEDWYQGENGDYIFNSNIKNKSEFDASGLQGTYIGKSWQGEGKNGDWVELNADGTKSSTSMLKAVEVVADRANSGGGSLFGDILTGTEKHFNGVLGTVGVAVQGYNNIPNDVKRAYAYKLSKMTGVKSGQIFQGAKGVANTARKWAKTLGPAGTILGVGVAGYEIGTNTWDAHTAVNIGLMLGAGAAAFVGAPAVLTGIAIYGVGDYFFDFGGTIDRNVGRNSGVWRP